ncbi:MAG: thioesterase family protein [Hyphomicrobiaceae bacterium]
MADLSKLQPGIEGSARIKVAPERMAPAMGSGGAPVFASPSMIALMEGAAVDCVEKLLPDGHQSLGTHLDVHHISATPEGLTVTAHAKLIAVDGRKLTFAVEAHDGIETIGKGTHIRVVVDTARFMARLAQKSSAGA